MSERGPKRRESPTEEIEREFGINLDAQLRALRESGSEINRGTLIRKIEGLLVEAGNELNPARKQQLQQMLRDAGF